MYAPRDRNWMNRRRIRGIIGTSNEFKDGCAEFLDYAFSHKECINEMNEIRCPCRDCKNVNYHRRQIVKHHLEIGGFMRDYIECWWAHGQKRPAIDQLRNPDIDSSNGSNNRMNDMARDIVGPNFDWEQNRDEPMNSDARDFFNLLDAGREPLWPGCETETTLSTVSKLLNIKSDFNMSRECFESLLKANKAMLPHGEKLPENFYFCKKMVKKLGLGYQKIDACPNDCMLYYKGDAQKIKCDLCGHDRFKPKKMGVKKKDVPFKVLRYFPITDRLKRLYLSSKTAQHMTWHATSPSKDGELIHPADGKAWKHFNMTHPDFALDPRNVRLGLSTDGFNPFGHSSVPYSCWPVIVTPYNLPPWMLMKQPYLFLSLIIPGPKSPGADLDVYLRPLIDELKFLWNDGVNTWDASRKSNFNLRAAIMWTISDFPCY